MERGESEFRGSVSSCMRVKFLIARSNATECSASHLLNESTSGIWPLRRKRLELARLHLDLL